MVSVGFFFTLQSQLSMYKTNGLVKDLLGFNFFSERLLKKTKIESQKDILGFTVNCYIFMCRCQLHQIFKMFNIFN